jgi:hypothetical protein
MDTVSLLVSRHVLAASRSILLVALLVSIGLVLPVVVGLGVDGLDLQPDGDRLLAPFRWRSIASNLA